MCIRDRIKTTSQEEKVNVLKKDIISIGGNITIDSFVVGEEVLANNIKLAGGDLPDKKITQAFAKDSKDAYDRLRENGLRPSINKERNTPKTIR